MFNLFPTTRKHATSTVAALCLCCLFSLLAAAGWAQAPQWLTSWDQAKSAAASQKKPVLVYFYNLKARPCSEMQLKTFADPKVTEKLKSFVCVSLHQPDNTKLFAEQFKLFKVPSVVLVDQNFKELDRAIGYKDATDFAQYLDRAIEGKGGGSLGSTGSINLSKPSTGTVPVKITYKNQDAAQAFIIGDFNDWRLDATPMQKRADGTWEVGMNLKEGVFEYKFFVDGQYYHDEANPLTKPNDYGNVNSVLMIGNPKRSPMIKGNSVTFILYRPEATKVELAGSFTNWVRQPMFPNPAEPGMWGVRYNLPSGHHEYKYIIDDRWQPDPENYTTVKDLNNNINSAFELP